MPPKPRPHGTRKPPPPGQGGRSRNVYLAAAAGVLGIAAIVVVLVLALGGGDGGDDLRAKLAAAGCELQIEPAPANSSNHSDIPTPDTVSDDWNTDPPTAGPHYGEWAIWGSYTDPLHQAQIVHNLEHGGVFIQYGEDVTPETIEQIQAFYADHRNGTIVAPLPRLGDRIAIGAWNTEDALAGEADRGEGVLATCTSFDRAAVEAFFDRYQFKGPERFPPESLAPGS